MGLTGRPMWINQTHQRNRKAHSRLWLVVALLSLPVACAAPPVSLTPAVVTGEYGDARAIVAGTLVEDRSDRRYLLDRLRLAVLTLADGYADASQPVFESIYETLRTQGINRDQTVASVVLNEDLKFWKGEPFEQAMAMFYYSVQQASLDRWDNARAAAGNALFHLRDFGTDDDGQRIDTLAIAKRAMAYERQQAQGGSATSGPAGGTRDYLSTGYTVRESNFALGYLMRGLAALQLQRDEEAAEAFNAVETIDPDLALLCEELSAGQYNTVLVVSYGLGPQKVGYGPDRALARFVPRYASDLDPLQVRVGNEPTVEYPVVCDLNRMAADHMWNNLEDVRTAKSAIGSALLIGGAVAANDGFHRKSSSTRDAGLGVLAVGMLLKAGAHVDTRFCDVLPQRVYLAPLHVGGDDDRIEVSVRGRPASRMVLAGLAPPPSGSIQLRYVRLVSERSVPPPVWTVSGAVFYDNDASGACSHTGGDGGPVRPYILGGWCIRSPNPAVLWSYHTDPTLAGLGIADLQELYQAEGIVWRDGLDALGADRHVLEGGRSLASPLAGTAGFARLVGQRHTPYEPLSERLLQFLGRTGGPGRVTTHEE